MSAPVNLQADLRRVIEQKIVEHPRSLQKLIGPSGLGTPCLRKLGHRIAQTPDAKPMPARWRPTVGTAVHAWAEGAFKNDNERMGWDRWLTETRVWVGDIGGEMITGSCDLYDRLTKTAIDWKFPGVTTIREKRKARHPGREYRVQAHLYGKGFRRLAISDLTGEVLDESFLVEHVAIYFLPAAGELADGYYWTEPFDEAVADADLARADGIAAAIAVAGADAIIPALPTANDYCENCPQWVPSTTNLAKACPGDDTLVVRDRPKEIKAFTPMEGSAS